MNQTWDPERYSQNARFVSELGVPLIRMLAPRAGERILDLGCGDGVLTKALVDLGCAVVGIDSSPEMVAAAKSLGLDARLMAGQEMGFQREFDAVFSNAALHWMLKPDEIIAGVWRALRSGGRFVGELGGDGNVASIVAALHSAMVKRGLKPEALNPWYFPSAEDYRGRLEARGFSVAEIDLIPRPTPLPGRLVDWLQTFARSFTAALPLAERAVFLREVEDACRDTLCDADGKWTADYVRLRFSAIRPRD